MREPLSNKKISGRFGTISKKCYRETDSSGGDED
jgi:hypothetical protein